MRRLALVVLAACLALPPAPARADSLSQLSASYLGLSSVAIASPGVTCTAVPMDTTGGTWNQLTFEITVTKGTSATLEVTCTASVDGTNYAPIQRCTDASPSVCAPRKWTYDLTVATTFVLNIPANYRNIKCTFNDPASGTGTITARGTRGKN